MTSALCQLTSEDLSQLAAALRSGRIAPPFSPLVLRRYVPESVAALVAVELQQRVDEGMESRHLADCLEMLCQDRRQRPVAEDLIDLVWTGPEAPGIVNRDASVVVREMFRSAKAIRARRGTPSTRATSSSRNWPNGWNRSPTPGADVPGHPATLHDRSSTSELVRPFSERFVRNEWPGNRLRNYYDPRSLETDYASDPACTQSASWWTTRSVRLFSQFHEAARKERRSRCSASLEIFRSEAHQSLRVPGRVVVLQTHSAWMHSNPWNMGLGSTGGGLGQSPPEVGRGPNWMSVWVG